MMNIYHNARIKAHKNNEHLNISNCSTFQNLKKINGLQNALHIWIKQDVYHPTTGSVKTYSSLSELKHGEKNGKNQTYWPRNWHKTEVGLWKD